MKCKPCGVLTNPAPTAVFAVDRSGGCADELENEVRPPLRSHLGGYINTFTSETLPVAVSVYCPGAAASQGAVEVFVYAHVAAAKRAAARHDATKFQAFRIDQAPLEPGDGVCRDPENTV